MATEKKESKSKVWLISLIVALLIFVTGFCLGVRCASTIISTTYKVIMTLTWLVPVLLVIFIIFLVIRHKLKKKREEKEARIKAEAEAKAKREAQK